MSFPKHYKLAKEHDKHFEIHDERDGSRFHVSKKDLHPANQIKVMRMQKFDDGGEVEGFDSGIKPWAQEEVKPSGTNSIFGLLPSDEEMYGTPTQASAAPLPQGPEQYVPPSSAPTAETPAQEQAPLVAQATEPPPPAPQQKPPPQVNPMAGMPTVASLQGMQGQYEKAVNQGAQGQIEQNKQIAQAYEPKLQAQEQAAKTFQESMQKYQQMADKLADDISSTKVDPNKYWADKGSHAKFTAGLAILLSGIGSGLGGGHNMALDVIQKNIDRDIDAQKTDLGKKQTLLSENFRQQGNLAAAEAATRAQYEAIFQGKLSQLAAKTNNPMVLSQAQQQIMESRLRMQQHLQPVAQNQMVMQLRDSLNKGGGQGQDPSHYVPYIVPEARQAEVFKEIQTAQNTKHMASNILAAFDSAAKDNTVMKTGAGLVRTPPSVFALHQHMQPTFQDLEGTVRQAAMDNTFKNVTPMPGDMESSIKTKRQALEQYLQSKMAAPTAKGFGIDLSKFGSTSPIQDDGSRMAAWASANPQDPRAKAVMQKLGH